MRDLTPLDSDDRPLLDIAGIVALLWSGKLWILSAIGLFLALAMAYLAVTPPVYTAQTVILIDPRQTNATDAPNVIDGIGTDSAAIASQVSVIASRDLLMTVFEEQDLARDSEFTSGGFLSMLRGGGSVTTEAAFEAFKDKFGVEREGLTYIINLTFTSTDAEKAARIVNAIARAYISGQVAEKTGVSTEVTAQLNQSIDKLQDEVADAERAVERFKLEAGIVDDGQGRTLEEARLEQLNTQLANAQEAERQARARYDQARQVGTSAEGLDRLTQILDSSSAQELRNSFNQRQGQLANARASLGPQHPTRIQLEAEVAQLRGLMRDEAERIIAELRAAVELAAANVQRVRDDLTRLQSERSIANQQAVELRQLQRNADASRQVLEQFLARSEQTTQLDNLQRPDARIISAASAPLKPTWPRRSLVLGAALLLGLMLGSVLAIALRPRPGAASALRPKRKPVRLFEKAVARQPRPVRKRAFANTPIAMKSRFGPPSHYRPTPRYLATIRSEAALYPKSPYGRRFAELAARIAEDLPTIDTAIIGLAGLGNRLEKDRVAFNLATCLHDIGLRPLIVTLDPVMTRRSRTTHSGRAIHDNDASQIVAGIRVIEDDDRASEVDRLEAHLADYAHHFDVVLVVGGNLKDPDALGLDNPYFDTILLALGAEEDTSLVCDEVNAGNATQMPIRCIAIHHGTEQISVETDPTGTHRPDPRMHIQTAVDDIRRVMREVG